jgi:hypothetical protein
MHLALFVADIGGGELLVREPGACAIQPAQRPHDAVRHLTREIDALGLRESTFIERTAKFRIGRFRRCAGSRKFGGQGAGVLDQPVEQRDKLGDRIGGLLKQINVRGRVIFDPVAHGCRLRGEQREDTGV